MKQLAVLAATALALAACGGSDSKSGPAAEISVTPATASMLINRTLQLTAAVTNVTDQTVTWSIQEGAAGGTISAAGLYTSPSTAGVYHIIATSNADHSKTATATITVALPALQSAAAINTYLDGKTWVMTGDDIPTYPNGFSEDVNYGSATQCYNKVTLSMAATTWTTVSALGTLTGAPALYATGDCDRSSVSNTLTFNSTNVLIENVQGNGACFDVTVTYTGFAQEGRGKFSDDGKTMTLELYFSGQATGHRCADGAVGAATVTLNGTPFTGNAQQVYRLQ